MMQKSLKIIFIFIICIMAYTLIINFPSIVATFDENKYVDGEVYFPVNNEYDFILFTINSSKSRNYTTTIATSGYCQFVDDRGNNTINVIEWKKMNLPQCYEVNSSLQKEFEKSSHMIGGIRIIDVDFLGYSLYASYLTNDDKSITIYIATPSENETLEMIRTLEFKEEFK